MLHWLRGAYNDIRVSVHLGLVVLTIHCCVLTLLFISNTQHQRYRMQVTHRPLTSVIFAPLTAIASSEVFLAPDNDTGVAIASQEKKPSVVQQKKPVVQKKRVAQKKTVPAKKKPITAKKEIQKKQSLPTPAKQPVKQINPAPAKVAPQKVTPQAVPLSQAAPQAMIEQNVTAQPQLNSVQEIVMIDEIQRKLRASWAPPAGLSPETSCELCMLIDGGGAVNSVNIVRSSGVLMFDLMAQSQCSGMIELPSWARGKEFYITFTV